MGFASFTTAELSQDKAIKSTTLHKIRNNLEWALEAFSYNLTAVPNCEFEFVTDNKPDLWDCTTYENGYVGSSTNSISGQFALMIAHDGSTRSGGQALSEYIPISTVLSSAYIIFSRYGDPLLLELNVNFYAGDFTANGSSKIYSDSVTTSGAGTWLSVGASFLPPANTRWIRIGFRNSTAAGATTAGNIYIDNVAMWADVTEY
jgi:hypothetical protein